MIFTLTINPSLDYVVDCSNFSLGKVNRTCSERIFAAGKGINVSVVLSNLGIKNTALGFTAGFTGREIERRLDLMGICTDFIELKAGESRINIKLRTTDGNLQNAAAEETEINARGPCIDGGAVECLLEKLAGLSRGDFLVLAGSVPPSVPQSFYADCMAGLLAKEVNVVVDAEQKLLLEALKFSPYLIKPNQHELGALFDAQILCKEDAVPYAQKLQKMGAKNVLVSFAKDGALLLDEAGSVWFCNAPKGKCINSVGAGDSMIAGFLCAVSEGLKGKAALKKAVCTGSASAFSETLATKESVEALFNSLV